LDVLPFSITVVIENEKKIKSHFYFLRSDNPRMELFGASLN
jgi:hypothetical protein